MLQAIQGKRTYITIGLALAYLMATKFGVVTENADVKTAFELIALGFIRAALGVPKGETVATK
jgi:hypothetical protein